MNNSVVDDMKYWFNEDGKLHRTNGSALTWDNGDKSYYLNGKQEFPEKQTLWINKKEII